MSIVPLPNECPYSLPDSPFNAGLAPLESATMQLKDVPSSKTTVTISPVVPSVNVIAMQ